MRALQPPSPIKAGKERRGSSDAAHSQSRSCLGPPPLWSQPGKEKRTLETPDLPLRGMRKELQVTTQGSSSRQGAPGDPEDTMGLLPTGLPQNWASHFKGHLIPSLFFLSPKQTKKRCSPRLVGLICKGLRLPPVPSATTTGGKREVKALKLVFLKQQSSVRLRGEGDRQTWTLPRALPLHSRTLPTSPPNQHSTIQPQGPSGRQYRFLDTRKMPQHLQQSSPKPNAQCVLSAAGTI